MTASKWQCPAGHQPAPDQPSTSTEGWHHTACQAAATARTHLDHARDQLVNVALEHTSRP